MPDRAQGAERVLADPPAVVASATGSGDDVASRSSSAQTREAATEARAEQEYGLDVEIGPVVGGTPAASGALPWMTFLWIETTPNTIFRCGGSLIAPQWVLTAAHCLNEATAVRAITGRTTAPVSLDDPDIVFADDWHVHPGYVPSMFGVFDIALVELSEASTAQTLHLANPADSPLYTAGTLATVAGWGRTGDDAPSSQVLLTGEMPIRSSADCAAAFLTFDATFNTCAGYSLSEASQPVGSCLGDSGGPLFLASGDTRALVQVGIVSYGAGVCTSLTHPGVYMRVSEFYEFVDDVVGDLPTPPNYSPSTFTPVGPDRAIDTRLNDGARMTAGSTLTVPVGSQYAGKSISVNLTVARALAAGYATLYACDQPPPGTSSLNYQTNQAIANGVITKVSAQGTVCVYLNRSAHVVLDVFGMFPSASAIFPPASVTLLPGTTLIGATAPAGRYIAQASFGCYWARSKSFEGTLESIIVNELIATAGSATVAIAPTDVGFKSTGDCGT